MRVYNPTGTTEHFNQVGILLYIMMTPLSILVYSYNICARTYRFYDHMRFISDKDENDNDNGVKKGNACTGSV